MNAPTASAPQSRALSDLLKDLDQLGLRCAAVGNCSRKEFERLSQRMEKACRKWESRLLEP